MKHLLLSLFTISLLLSASALHAAPVFSAHGMVCGQQGPTVTCKGKLNQNTLQVTGRDVVVIAEYTKVKGVDTRINYFSDTGCKIAEMANNKGDITSAIAYHRGGARKEFQFTSKDQYDQVLQFCILPSSQAKGMASK